MEREGAAVTCNGIVRLHKHVSCFVNCLEACCTVFKAYFHILFVVNEQSGLVCVEQMKKCMELEEKLKTMDRDISTNPQYVQKVNTERVLNEAV